MENFDLSVCFNSRGAQVVRRGLSSGGWRSRSVGAFVLKTRLASR